jgi:gliding motility-associated-like protein
LDNDSIITPSIISDTSFSVIITDACGYSQSDTIYISLPSYSEVSASTPLYYLLCKEDTLSVEALAGGGAGNYTYTWIGDGEISDAANSQTLLTPVDESGYTLIVTDQCGDADTLSIAIEFDDCTVVGPKVFTPNGDGYNQHLTFTNLEKHPNSKIVIYNRWGSKVYESDHYLNNWNGGNQKDGVYFYILYVSNGEELQSYIHLIR